MHAAEVEEFILKQPHKICEYLLQDLPRWEKILKLTSDTPFVDVFSSRQEFRSVVHYRARMAQKIFEPKYNILHQINKILGHGQHLYISNLYLFCPEIGPGLYIEHGFSTIVFAKKIGANFWLNQNVTIGSGKGGNPVIGDNVSVRANSVVIGNIRVADNVIVGAGAVLNFEVPEGSRVVPQKVRVLPPK